MKCSHGNIRINSYTVSLLHTRPSAQTLRAIDTLIDLFCFFFVATACRHKPPDGIDKRRVVKGAIVLEYAVIDLRHGCMQCSSTGAFLPAFQSSDLQGSKSVVRSRAVVQFSVQPGGYFCWPGSLTSLESPWSVHAVMLTSYNSPEPSTSCIFYKLDPRPILRSLVDAQYPMSRGLCMFRLAYRIALTSILEMKELCNHQLPHIPCTQRDLALSLSAQSLAREPSTSSLHPSSTT